MYIFRIETGKHQLILLHSSFQTGLANGGPGGLIYGYLFAWLGTFLQALVMGESKHFSEICLLYINILCAMLPLSDFHLLIFNL